MGPVFKRDKTAERDSFDRIIDLIIAEEGTEEGDEAEVLMLNVEDYEEKYHSIGNPDPKEAIKFIMEQKDLKQKGFAEILGYRRNPDGKII
jgi:HTH-type transcriptional regulator/antitoxin HigA